MLKRIVRFVHLLLMAVVVMWLPVNIVLVWASYGKEHLLARGNSDTYGSRVAPAIDKTMEMHMY